MMYVHIRLRIDTLCEKDLSLKSLFLKDKQVLNIIRIVLNHNLINTKLNIWLLVNILIFFIDIDIEYHLHYRLGIEILI